MLGAAMNSDPPKMPPIEWPIDIWSITASIAAACIVVLGLLLAVKIAMRRSRH